MSSEQQQKLELLENALRLTEAKLHALVSDSQDMIMTIDSAGRIADINKSGAQLLGYERDDQVIGRVEAELWSNERDHDVLMHLIRENGFVKNFEVILRRADGAAIFGLESATLIRNPDGGVFQIHAMVKDITARIHDEEARWKMSMQLAEANQKLKESQALIVQREKLASIGQLAAGIAHEINNPLGFMKSNHSALAHFIRKIEAYLRRTQKEETAAHAEARAAYDIDYIMEGLGKIMEDLDEGFRRISEIVQNLRTFSRIDTGDSLASFDINAGIQKTVIVAQNELKYTAAVSMKLDPLPPVECAEGEILQVFLNVIVNAAQAIKAQGRAEKGKIEIRTGTLGDTVWIEVEDDGPGIPREDQLKIFDPFFTTKPVGQGTGLGLSISHEIIARRHGGSLTVRSEPGKGACFRIELPVAHPKGQ
jgi:PAS domain S-box-containing protein